MRILFVTPYFKPFVGGVERAVDELTKTLLGNKGITKVSILTTFSSYPNGNFNSALDYEVDEGREIFRLDFRPKDIPGIYHAYNAGYFSAALGKLLKKLSPDVVHFCKIEWFVPNLLVYFFTRKKSSHYFFSSYHPKPLSAKHLAMLISNRYLLNRMKKVHAPSQFIAKATGSAFNVADKRILAVPLGVNPINGRRSRNNERVQLLLVGRFSRTKGQLEFVKYLIENVATLLEKINIIMVGRDAGDLALIKDLVLRQPLLQIRIFENASDRDLTKLYLESDIFVSTSFMEGFGIAIIEAMRAGLPVVAFSCGAISEIVSSKAELVEPGDWAGLIDGLERLIESPELRRTYGKESKEFVNEKYTWARMAKEISKMYLGN